MVGAFTLVSHVVYGHDHTTLPIFWCPPKTSSYLRSTSQPKNSFSIQGLEHFRSNFTATCCHSASCEKTISGSVLGSLFRSNLFQIILRKVRSILNKLTPQKFQPLMVTFLSLEINSETRLRGVIDLIFEKVCI